jgi:hypothetical protein
VLPVILESDLAVNLREQRVILAETDVQNRLEPPTLSGERGSIRR